MIDRTTALVADALQAAAAEGPSGCDRSTLSSSLYCSAQRGGAEPGGRLARERSAWTGASGRERLVPQLVQTMHLALRESSHSGASVEDLVELWLSLLICDLQVRRVTGALPALSPEALTGRSDLALTRLLRLHGTGSVAPCHD